MRPSVALVPVLALLALLLLAGVAAAGTRGNPEVTDPRADTVNTNTAQPVLAPTADVRAAWFEESATEFQLRIRVQDLVEPTGTTTFQYIVDWDADGEGWRSFVNVYSDGTAANLNTYPGASAVAPSNADGTVTVSLDTDLDEIKVVYPRSFDTARAGLPDPMTFASGTVFRHLRVASSTGTGTSSTPQVYTQVDDTEPGRDFTFDQARRANPHVFLQPASAVQSVTRGDLVTIPLTASSPTGLDLAANIVATTSRADWTVEDAAKDLRLGTDGKGTDAVHVRVPQFATPGEACLVTVTGGAFAVTVLLVVDDATGAASKAAAAAASAPPLTSERVVRQATLYLQGNTTTGATGSGKPLVPGRLVDSAPTGTGADGILLQFGQTLVLPVGQWTTAPLASATNVSGTVRLDAWARWSGVTGVKVRALVGPAPLPLDWNGRATLAGVLALEPANTGVGNAGQLTASANFPDKLTLGAGDRLAVALYVEVAGGNGAVLVQEYSKATPSRITVNVEEHALPRPVPGVLPSSGAAAFRGSFAPPLGSRGLEALTTTIQGAAGPVPLAFTAVPVDVRWGPSADTASSETLVTTPFSPFAGSEPDHVHAFEVAPASKRVDVLLRGPTTNDPANDNDLDLVVRRADGVVVRAARTEGPAETVTLGPELLARYGPGRYEAVVRLDRSASATATSLPYTVDVVEHTSVTQKGAGFSTAAVWSFKGKTPGDYTLTMTRGDRATPESVSTVYRLTDVGPTLAPTADFSYAPLLPVSGQLVNFTDLSTDLDGRLATWAWRFGDGTTSNVKDPQHAFPRPGAYRVDLTVADDFNATALSIARVVDVGNAPPVAAFVSDPLVGTSGQAVTFTDRSFDPDGNISDRAWSFGDGTGSSEKVVEHVFSAPGTYNVSLTVFDEPRSLLTGSRVVRAFVVVDPGAASTGRPTADFEAPLNPVEGRPVRFTDASFWEEGILERRWDFGDGGVSSEEDPLHTFAVTGEYQVTLTVFPPGRQDLTASLTRVVRVAPASGMAATFTMTPGSPATSDVVTFTDTTTVLKGDVARHWDFGDGSSPAAGATATHVFPRAGTFTVRLTVSDRDGAQATGERDVVVTRASLLATPAPDTPRGGSVFHYKADYDRGVEHKEDYAATWREDELAGLLKPNAEYLATPGAYVHGTSLATPSTVAWGGGAVKVTNAAGATTTALGAEVLQAKGAAVARALPPASAAVGSRPVDLSALDAPPASEDDLADGLFRIETVLEGGGIQVRRSTTLLDGALHADVRTLMIGQADDPMRLVTQASLAAPRGSWLATWDGDAVRTFPAEGADNLTYDLGGHSNRWFAVFDPVAKQVSGVVVSGDVTGITLLRRADDVVVRVDHVGLGEVLAAEYLIAYEVTDTDATRYAGVMELARQDDEEVGMAVLGEGRAAAVAWAGGGASLGVEASGGLGAWWDRVNGLPDTWTLTLDAPSTDDGKAMRIVLPGSIVRDGGVQVLLDGEVLSALAFEAVADDGTLVLVVPVEHFSRHELTIRSVVPGLPKPFLYIGLAFGVVVGGGALFAGQQMRSRAATRALGGDVPVAPPASILPGVRSTSGAGALGDLDSAAAKEVRQALLRKLGDPAGGTTERARYARCTNCQAPVRFAAGEVTTACPRCGAANTQPDAGSPGGDT